MKVGFVGLGIMGKPMCKNILKAGYTVTAYNPSPASLDEVVACGAIRDDGTSKAYVDVTYPAVPDPDLLQYCRSIAKEEGWGCHTGIVHSHESFYIDDNAKIEAGWSKKGVLGADMETAALFVAGRLRHVATASILNNVVVYGSDTADAIGSYSDGAVRTAEGERREIATALEALYRYETER